MDLWAQPLTEDRTPRGPPVPLTTGIGFRNAALSPDGSRLAYSKGQYVSNGFRVPVSTERPATWSDAEQLTFDLARIEFLDVSKDGKRLLFSSDRAGNQDLWLMAIETGEMKQLTTEITPDWAPRWSPDENEIAFYSHRSGNRDVWVMPVSGGSVRQLTRDEAGEWLPSWAPDGKEIVYLRHGTEPWVVPADGGEARQIGFYAIDFGVEWSPDAKWLGFIGESDRGPHVWRVAPAGGDPEKLTAGQVRTFRWSLDGKKVYYIGRADREGTIWEYSLDDGLERPLTNLGGRRGALGGLGLSTDGQYVYFTWEEDIGDIWVMDVVSEEP